MPKRTPSIAIVYDSASRRRTATFTGEITDEHLVGTYADLVQAPDYDAEADELVDLRGVTSLGVTTKGLRQLMGLFSELDKLGIKSRLAIVAPGDAVYGVARMYQMLRGDDVPEEITVFRDFAEATAWLDEGRANRG